MDILSIILVVAACIGGLLVLWALIALTIFGVASRRIKKNFEATTKASFTPRRYW